MVLCFTSFRLTQQIQVRTILLRNVDFEIYFAGIGSFAMSKKDHDGMVMPIDEVDPIYSRTLDFIRTVLSD